MPIHWYYSDDEREPACGDCGHPLETHEVRFGRCQNCGGDLNNEEQDPE
jgi:Zn finger protein HypA/HybF involved in hydrogenase expression